MFSVEVFMKLSVLICTRNRVKSLDATLNRFFQQKFNGEYQYEIVVIDNNSTDETGEVIERYVAKHPQIISHYFEPRCGLTYARNTALAAATGEIIVFTDDDVLVDENWLNEIHREFNSDPDLFMLGGRVLLANDKLQTVSLQPSDVRQIFAFPDNGGFAMGANMAFRRQVFDRIGVFDVRLGSGRFFAGADDTDFFYRALKAGYNVFIRPMCLFIMITTGSAWSRLAGCNTATAKDAQPTFSNMHSGATPTPCGWSTG
jgi:glycosyltransferase involved in cell wall biosynthesis